MGHKITDYDLHEFEATENLQLENSFGIIDSEKSVKLQVTIGIPKEGGYGFFEFYDLPKSRFPKWYAEGSLKLEGKDVVGYDGVFSILPCITNKLKELGYNVDEVES
jgi:hypothetical protein